MDTLKTIGTVVLTSLILFGGSLLVQNNNLPKDENGNVKVSSATNPIITSPYFGFGDVVRYAYNPTLKQNASTTVSIQSPTATSTLVSAACRFDTASSTALLVEMGTDTASPMATTTLLGRYTISAGAQGIIVASTSPTVGDAVVFSPGEWFNVKIGGGGTGSLPVGNCHAVFEVI